ncbi:family 2 glycoside hydrolase [Cryphonectria parasitica EP155]|uniref:Family 2 glycoside hydrolase n=1 Tax=Cryphonectria parasitica (strain ATCC 38755 / EP155) TaxID=660469 RepID=A0A9P5CPX6_CRYP1|nr:family 2 glycoside hydrolase [Cryphonectria parasitica EP155]KAF3766623.1 family 2 glycoside hydrolase [Cryphonectria parasitica EP155]
MSSPSYPRPDFQRPGLNWASLNGPWDFFFDDKDEGLSENWHLSSPPASLRRTIEVPYAFQTPASGINERAAHEVLWYQRTLKDIRTDDSKSRGDRLLLRFGAVDYEATVWLDGQLVGSHRGGHVPFEVDVTNGVAKTTAGEARLTLRVRDSPYDLTQPRGKQYWGPEPESIFYTPTSGIWQNVWLESVPSARIADSSAGTVLRSNDINTGNLHAKVAVVGRRAQAPCSVEIEASFLGLAVGSGKGDLARDRDYANLVLNLRLPENEHNKVAGTLAKDDSVWRSGLALWSPEHPLLYDLTLRLLDPDGNVLDQVETTTGMRSIDWLRGDGTFRLNGRPIFQSLCLDQGYWPETYMTPPSADALKEDIKLSKDVGFNGCRKHQKVEDPVFLYWADRLGYLVWGEAANAYEFSDEYVERFNAEWTESIKRDMNHPSIVAWTPVNESWAYPKLSDNSQAGLDQRNHIRQLYYLTKSLDPTRPINDNCGWEHVLTDLSTFHDYADGPAIEKICSTLPGIIHRTIPDQHPMFVGPIYGPNALVLDPATEHKSGAPVICTEFGGVNIAPATGGGSGKKFSTEDWGYTTAADPDDLLKRIEKLALGVVGGGHCCGLVYTQLTDIEQEVNGIYSFDRKAKIDPARVKAIFDKAAQVYLERHRFGFSMLSSDAHSESVLPTGVAKPS